MNIFMDSPIELLEEVWKDRNVHILEKTMGGKHCLIDISLDDQQNQLFSLSSFYRANLRSSTCIFETIATRDIDWGAKGFPKIFELEEKYLQTELAALTDKEKNIHQSILNSPYSSLQHGVEIVKMNKIEGDCVLVSHRPDGWIISSNRISILVECEASLAQSSLTDPKYDNVKITAKMWLDLLVTLDTSLIAKILEGVTLIGAKYHDSLSKKGEERLAWIGLVNNSSQVCCENPLIARQLLRKMGLASQEIVRLGVANTKIQLNEILKAVQLEISESHYQANQNGVIYLISREKCVGVCKVTSVESLIFNLVEKQLKKQTKLDKFITLLKRIVKNSCPPYPLQYYIDIYSTIDTLNLPDEQFLSTLKTACFILQKKGNPTKVSKAILQNKVILENIKQVPLKAYGALNCKTVVIYVVLGLFRTVTLGTPMQQHFTTLGLHFQIIPEITDITDIVQIITQDRKGHSLEHYLLSTCFLPQQIRDLSRELWSRRSEAVHYTIMAIREKEQTEINKVAYPLSWESIILSYYTCHQRKLNAHKVTQKIENLKKITDCLHVSRSWVLPSKVQIFEESHLKSAKIIFADDAKASCFAELKQFTIKMLNGQKEEASYCSMILRLEKINAVILDYPEEQIERMIRESYPVGSRFHLKFDLVV